jgi:hypothetical protein
MIDVTTQHQTKISGKTPISRAFHNYLKILAALFAPVMLAMAATNALVDPFAVFPATSLPQLHPYRALGTRVTKAELLAQVQPQILILGSSRAETGLDPHSPLWKTDHVFNAALTGAGFEEIGHVFDYALRSSNPKLVVLTVDFLMFTSHRSPRADFERSRFNPNLPRTDYLLANLFSYKTTSASLDALTRYFAGAETEYTQLGHHREKYPAEHRRLFASVLPRKFFQNRETYLDYTYDRTRLQTLRHIAATCRDRQIDLVVLIPPVHALQLEAIRLMDLWPTFEQWKADLLAALDDLPLASTHPSERSLWDFTGYTGPMAEPVPAADEVAQHMTWYFESSHFKPALGELVIARILSHDAPPHSPPTPPIGTPLTSTTIQAHLQRLRNERELYAQSQPHEIAWIQALHAQSTTPPQP